MKVIYIILVIFLSTLIGTAIGELLSLFLNSKSFLYHIFASGITPSWKIEKLDLIVATINLGITIKLNVMSILGMVIGAVFSLKKL